MKKIIKISYLYFATGLILALYSILNGENQALNIDDTYYVISANNFALLITLIYLILGVIFLVIEKYLSRGIKVFQYITFNIPLIYFLFSDFIVNDSPLYYLTNPIAYEWFETYIPTALIFSFLLSIFLFFILFLYAFWKWRKKNKASI